MVGRAAEGCAAGFAQFSVRPVPSGLEMVNIRPAQRRVLGEHSQDLRCNWTFLDWSFEEVSEHLTVRASGIVAFVRLLDYNPVDRVQWKSPEVAEEVDRRVVASTAQVEAVLDAVPTVAVRAGHYRAFYGCLYYAANCQTYPEGQGRQGHERASPRRPRRH